MAAWDVQRADSDGESYMDSDTDMLPGICGSDTSSLEEDDFLVWDYRDDIPSGDPFVALGHVKGPQTHGKEILWSALSQQQVNKLRQGRDYIYLHGPGGAGSFLKFVRDDDKTRCVDQIKYYIFQHAKSGRRVVLRSMPAGNPCVAVMMSQDPDAKGGLLIKAVSAFNHDEVILVHREPKCHHMTYHELLWRVRKSLG
jgi:hypothetical protein